LTVVEEVPDVTANAQAPVASAIKTRGPRRPRLSPDEKREIARLYADTSTSTSEICARLGIGESSLYRIIQLQGLPLRGRTASSASPGAASGRASKAEVMESGGHQTLEPTVAPSTSGAKSVTRRRRTTSPARRPSVEARAGTPGANAASVPARTRRVRTTAAAARSGELLQFTITYAAEHTLQAASALDALQQAQARGATEVISIVRIG